MCLPPGTWEAIVARSTYRKGKRCLLCAGPIADQSSETDLHRRHREPARRIQIATAPGFREILTLTHAVIRRGERCYAGTGEDGRRVVWEDGEPVGGRRG